MRPTSRNSSDTHLRALERRVLAGDLTVVSELARIYERVARGEPPFDIAEQTRRLVADVERVEESGEPSAIRNVLTELTHLARERGVDIEERLAAAIQVADEEEDDELCPDCGGAQTPEGRGLVPTFSVDAASGRRRRAGPDNCEHDCHDGPEEEDEDERSGTYVIGSLVIPGATCNERWSSGVQGSIVIGGDRGDVHAREATNTRDGVEVHGVELRTSLNGLTDDEARETAMDVVRASWESVGEDAFRITRRRR